MPNIVITEAEFEAVANAACDAWDNEDFDRAAVLDKHCSQNQCESFPRCARAMGNRFGVWLAGH